MSAKTPDDDGKRSGDAHLVETRIASEDVFEGKLLHVMRQPDGALAYRDADAPGAEIERKNGPRARGAGGWRPDHA